MREDIADPQAARFRGLLRSLLERFVHGDPEAFEILVERQVNQPSDRGWQ